MMRDDVLKTFEGRNVLVTGGTGMIGRQAVSLLENAGARVRIASLDRLRVSDKAEHVFADLTELSCCRDVCSGMDDVLHMAGIGASVHAAHHQPASHFVPMLMMNLNMLESCRRAGIQRVVYTSSVGAYAPAEVFRESDYRLDSLPMDFAGWAKRMAEAQIEAYGVEYGLKHFAIVRPSNVYGPGDNFDPARSLVIPSLLYRIHSGERPLRVWGDGSALRDFVYSRDVAEGVLLALHYGTHPGFVNLGYGTPHSVRELVECLRSFIPFDYEFDPTQPTGVPRRVMDISRARAMIHYEPTTSLREGLELTWNWYLAHPHDHDQKKNYFAPAETP